ncbi:hypothetical protein ACIPSA_25320 [Streptomyces sp. NPDC086549]|uniref:hypothetical protein n=1 Tax=Streptomyces sp. NPDC086549 TaxID=3365752 RepID=UPI003813A48C
MAPVPNGTYTISRPGGQLLTLERGSPEPKTPVVLLPPSGHPGEQEWQLWRLKKLGNGSYAIRNLRGGTYLSLVGDPETNKPLFGYPQLREWTLQDGTQPGSFHLVPTGPIHCERLAADVSPLRIFPPRTALRPLDTGNLRQAWSLRPAE